jgi:hypothetical protein
MINMQRLLAVLCLGIAGIGSMPAAPVTGFPFADEDLTYTVNWPSGLSLGEGHMHAKHEGSNWSFELLVDASVPGFQVKDVYRSVSNAGFCSVSFDRNTSHGSKKAQEKETIDGTTATRDTLSGGGGSRIPVSDCVKDALTFLYFARRELGQGRVPPAQQILMGGLYQIRLDYAGAQSIPVNEVPTESDKIVCTVKGPASEFKFEVYFARDAARTPLLFKAPLAMGMFSMELVR